MFVLFGEKWEGGFLDYSVGSNDVRIRVRRWRVLQPVNNQYFVRPKSFRLLLNYLKEIGPMAVIRKIVSRGAEGIRNEKYLSVGLGEVLETGEGVDGLNISQVVAFVAATHPRCVDTVVVDAELVFPWALDSVNCDDIEFLLPLTETGREIDWGSSLAGWARESGSKLPVDRESVWADLPDLLAMQDHELARTLVSPRRKIETDQRSANGEHQVEAVVAVLFGYGNYAKTVVIPRIREQLLLRTVHEIDPLQIPRQGKFDWAWSTSPLIGHQEKADAYFIAGYHHTHADLAIAAIESGAYAVVEKPLVTSRAQMERLSSVVRSRTGKLFAGFHRRYSAVNDWLFSDLGVSPGEPLSYHCIVYEEPLPAKHWYRWPVSNGRIVCNGCHWIDHFLYINEFSAVEKYGADAVGDGIISCWVELENSAVFTMVLTDNGSRRLGMQNHIEIRHGNGTVHVHNDARYSAETHARLVNRKAGNRLTSYSNMYRSIAASIRAGKEGDSWQSFQSSCNAVLLLAESADS